MATRANLTIASGNGATSGSNRWGLGRPLNARTQVSASGTTPLPSIRRRLAACVTRFCFALIYRILLVWTQSGGAYACCVPPAGASFRDSPASFAVGRPCRQAGRLGLGARPAPGYQGHVERSFAAQHLILLKSGRLFNLYEGDAIDAALRNDNVSVSVRHHVAHDPTTRGNDPALKSLVDGIEPDEGVRISRANSASRFLSPCNGPSTSPSVRL